MWPPAVLLENAQDVMIQISTLNKDVEYSRSDFLNKKLKPSDLDKISCPLIHKSTRVA